MSLTAQTYSTLQYNTNDICPICGAFMICICKTAIPPIYESYCQKCGYRREKPKKAEVHISTKGTGFTMPEEIKNEEKDKKPPVGLEPRYIHKKRRIEDIFAAMKRYSAAEMVIPIEWIEELEEHFLWSMEL